MADVPYEFLKRLKIKSPLVREFLAEFLGTFILILIGDAAFADAILGGNGHISDVFAITWAWGIAVMVGIAVSGGVSGGHINPAVTVAFATLGKFPWRKVPIYVLAQHLGGFIASAVLYVNYIDALDHFDPDRTVVGNTSTALIWATYPKEYVGLANCFLDQIVGTGILMFSVMAIIDEKNTNIPKSLHGILLGFMVNTVALCFGLNCMAALNPARDFATRLFTAVVGYGFETFTYRHFWFIGIVPVHLGAILGGWIYYLGIELHHPPSRRNELLDELNMPLNDVIKKGCELKVDYK